MNTTKLRTLGTMTETPVDMYAETTGTGQHAGYFGRTADGWVTGTYSGDTSAVEYLIMRDVLDRPYVTVVGDTLSDGGATFYRDGRPVKFGPVRRYVVGGVEGYRASVPSLTFDALDIRAVVEQNPEHDTFGTWIDPDTSMVDIEPVEVLTNLDTALAFARERGEKAIWDAVEGREIWVQREPEPEEEQDVAVRFRLVGEAGKVDALLASVVNALGAAPEVQEFETL